jgi:hypothetical protein
MKSEEKITPDNLLDAMAEADVLEVFCHLPEVAKQEFRGWIGKARDDELHWRRIDALVSAMRSGPLFDRRQQHGDPQELEG